MHSPLLFLPCTGKRGAQPCHLAWFGGAVHTTWPQHFEQARLPFCFELPRVIMCMLVGEGGELILQESSAHVWFTCCPRLCGPASSYLQPLPRCTCVSRELISLSASHITASSGSDPLCLLVCFRALGTQTVLGAHLLPKVWSQRPKAVGQAHALSSHCLLIPCCPLWVSALGLFYGILHCSPGDCQ